MNENKTVSCHCGVFISETTPGNGYAMRLACTGILASVVLLGTVVPAAAQRAVTVKANTIQSLDAKLQSFAQGLAPSERAAWDAVLRQAASAPADNAAEVAVKPTFYGGSGSTGPVVTRDAAGGIIVQGGRTSATGADTRASAFNAAIGRGGIDPRGGGDPAAIGPKQEDPARGGGGRGAVSIGPKQEDPARGGGGRGAVSIGPKQEDPARGGGGRGAVSIGPKQEDPARGGGRGAVSIGPKQEDPTRGGGTGPASTTRDPGDPLVSLDEKVQRFAGGLSGGEQATFDWLLHRATKQSQRGGGAMPVGPGGKPAGPAASREAEGQRGPGGLPAGAAQTAAGQRNPGPGGMPGRAPSLGQALGQGSASTDVVLRF